MKKFRKSFVILPALATMALTTVASVTGTIAWFTANKAVTATASSFIANYNDGNLTVTATSVQEDPSESGAVDALTVEDSKNIKVNEDILFTDASYDASTDTLWSDVDNNNGEAPTTFESKGGSSTAATGWVKDANNKEVYAVTWTYKFQYEFASDIANKYDLAFDVSNSSMTSEGFGGVAGGFRISMTCGGKTVVFAPSEQNIVTYITDANGTTANYTLTKTGTTTPELTAGSDHSSSPAYLGTFTPTAAYTKANDLDVRCVAWFEGTDTDHVVISKAIKAVSATLGFKTVKAGAVS